MNILLPFRSDNLPISGMKRARDMEKPEKIIPNQTPFAPRDSA